MNFPLPLFDDFVKFVFDPMELELDAFNFSGTDGSSSSVSGCKQSSGS